MITALNLAKMETTGSRLGFDSGINTVSTNPNCGGPTVGDTPVAGCGSTDFWSPWRWDPKKYFAARDAKWRGTVTVGSLEDMAKPAPKASAQPSGMRRHIISAALLLVFGLLAGCGQKGPLVMPAPKPVVTPPSASASMVKAAAPATVSAPAAASSSGH
jgi:predicted small lipoprotein YifL